MTTKITDKNLANTGVVAGSYSNADITVNDQGQITSASSGTGGGGLGPKITGIAVTDSSYNLLDDTAVGLSGGYIKITGTGFVTGCSVIINATVATSVSFISSTEVRAQVPAQSAGTYTVYLVNPDGGVGIRVNGLNYSSTPTWTTTSPLGDGAIDTAISVQLAATSNSTVTYALQAGSTLPAGLSLSSGGLLSGTVTGITVDTTYNFTVVATDQESQDTPQAFSITISVNDPYFKNTVLLLQADTAPTIISDASANNFNLTVSGDARASNFTPYGTGWSVYFDGSGDYLTAPSNTAFAFSTGNFTIEAWIFPTSTTSYRTIFTSRGTAANAVFFGLDTGTLFPILFTSVAVLTSSIAVNLNTWNHVALVRNNGTSSIYVNGVSGGSASNTTDYTATNCSIGIENAQYPWFGYISNLRIIKGQALFTGTFTPGTAALTANSVGHSGAGAVASINEFYYATWSNGSLTVATGSTSAIASTIGKSSGKWYWEVTPTALGSGNPASLRIGVCNASGIGQDLGGSGNGWCFLGDGRIFNNNAASSYGTAITTNDVLNVALDIDAGKIWYGKNGTWMASGNPVTGANPSQTFSAGQTMFAAVASGIGTPSYLANFGSTTFSGAVPSGYVGLRSNSVSLLTCHANRFLDASSNGFAITKYGDAAIRSFHPFGITDTGVNGSTYFDNTGDYLQVLASTAMDFSSSNFTVEFFVYHTSLADFDTYFDTRLTTRGIHCFVSSNGTFYYDVKDASDTLILRISTSSGVISTNNWIHVAICRNSGTTTIYVNGTSVASATDSNTYTSATDRPYIGDQRTGSSVINGYLSNFRVVKSAVYTAAFTPPTQPLTAIANTQLLTLQYDQPHNNHTFLDSSSNQFVVTRSGNTTQGTFSPFSQSGWSNYFDGSGDYLSIADNVNLEFGSSTITLECWFYMTGSGGYLLDKNNSASGAAPGFSLNVGTTGIVWYYDAANNGYVISPISITITQNAWHHIALVRSVAGSTINSVFLDGVRVGTSSTSNAFPDNTQPFRIGSTFLSGAAYGFFTGYVSNVRLVKGTAVYDPTQTSLTVPTAPLTAITNTQLLTCHENRFLDSSTNNFTITRNGDTRVVNFSPFAATAVYNPAVHGGSAYFDGTGDYLTVPHDPAVVLNNEDWTIEFWVYPTVDARADVICKGNGGSYVPYMIILLPSGQINFNASNSGSGHAILLYSNTGDYRLFQWNHIAVTKSGSTIRIFCQGALVATGSYSGGAMTNSLPLGIGAGSDGGQRLTGYMSNVRIIKGTALYTSAFTVPTAPPTATTNTSLLLNFTDAAIRDSRGLAVLETVGDAKTSTVQVKYGTGSMRFDGTGDYLVPYNPNTNTYAFGSSDFTIEFWVRFGALAGNQIIYDSRPSATDGLYPMIYANGTSLRYYVNAVDRITSNTLSTNVWYHVAVARSGTSTKMFIDGTQAGSTYTDSTVYINATNRPLIAQNGTNLGAALNGYIDDLRVTTGIARYTQNFTPPTAKFLAK